RQTSIVCTHHDAGKPRTHRDQDRLPRTGEHRAERRGRPPAEGDRSAARRGALAGSAPRGRATRRAPLDGGRRAPAALLKRYSTFFSRSSAICPAESPTTRASTSSVCSPSIGGGRRYSAGVSEKSKGLRTPGTWPASG